MIIGKDSPLNRLPSNLDRRQTLFFDGIRYSLEMADTAYERLVRTLLSLVPGDKSSQNRLDQTVTSAMLDAWSLIDSVHRLRVLLKRTPRLKQKLPWLAVFYKATEEVDELRNIAQHLDVEIPNFIINDSPIWGVFTWLVATKQTNDVVFFSCLLVAGTLAKTEHRLINPAGLTMHAPVDRVTLTVNGHSVCLSTVMGQLPAVVSPIEKALAEQCEGLPHAGADLFMSLAFKGETKKDG